MCGSFGDLSTFSFYANKQVTCGEGGMISTNNFNLYQKCKSFRNLSFGKIQRFNHEDISWNYDDKHSSCIRNKSTRRLDNTVKKMYIGKYYFKIIKE